MNPGSGASSEEGATTRLEGRQMSAVIEEASRWFARLQDPESGARWRAEWRRWLESSQEHQAAWAKVEAVQRRFAAVPGHIALPALNEAGRRRRQSLRWMVGGAVLVPLGGYAWRTSSRRGWFADVVTAKGEIETVPLSDGSLAVLDSESAVDVLFDAEQRLLRLVAGRIYIQTRPDPGRPFVVATRHGRVQALGTEFVVGVSADGSEVKVNRHAVRVTPASDPLAARVVHAGEAAEFSATRVSAATPLAGTFAAWRRGSLVAMEMPMAQVVEKLRAYRPGYLGLDERLADLPVSGVFPLGRTDMALAALENGYGVRVRQLTRYWTWIEPRP